MTYISKSSPEGILYSRQHPPQPRSITQKKYSRKVPTTQPTSVSQSSTGHRSRQNPSQAEGNSNLTTRSSNSDLLPNDAQIVRIKNNKHGKGNKIAKSKDSTEWKLSQFVGGRYSALDPVFSKDERHIFIANANLLKVFSTKTSLLVRTIAVPSSSRNPENIIGYNADARNEDRIFIATPSRIFLWDWSSAEQIGKWQPQLGGILQQFCITSCSEAGADNSRDIFLVAKRPGSSGSTVWTVTLDLKFGVEKAQIFETDHYINTIRVVDGGRAVCVIADKVVFITNYDGTRWLAPRTFTFSQKIICMDVYLQADPKGKKGKAQRISHVVVGDKTGALYILHDVLLKPPINDLVLTKLHWHRKAVRSVKWALNGSYVVSGGTETVLVIWQLETGNKQYLPHLGASIRSIVVSPGGASYAISLSDNSVIIVSTAELKATANIAGIQSISQNPRLQNRIPCLLHPTTTYSLLLAAPPNQFDGSTSSPYLQTYDIHSDRHISRQALTRTNATNVNQGPDHTAILEPNIVGLSATADGQWLASVDEWHLPRRTASGVETVNCNRIREVFLKFWKWNSKRKEWELVTRVDTPHPSQYDAGAEQILDISAAPDGQEFATIGADGCARIWKPKDRNRTTGKTKGLPSWGCRQSIPFTKQRIIQNKLLVSPFNEASLNSKRHRWGDATYSEDGSLLAVVSPEHGFSDGDSIIHILSLVEGTVMQTLGGMNIGRSHGVAIIERYLIVAGSQKLLVWNLVNGQMEWELIMQDTGDSVIPSSIHLAADHYYSTFALAFSKAEDTTTEIHVFNPSVSSPMHSQSIHSSIAALKTMGGGKGYMVLDCEARIQFLSPAHLGVTQSVARGPISADEVESRLSELYLGNIVAATVKSKPITSAGEAVKIEDLEMSDGVGTVVPREKLGEIFDKYPSCATGPTEGIFDRVFDLFMQRALEDDNEDEDEHNSR